MVLNLGKLDANEDEMLQLLKSSKNTNRWDQRASTQYSGCNAEIFSAALTLVL